MPAALPGLALLAALTFSSGSPVGAHQPADDPEPLDAGTPPIHVVVPVDVDCADLRFQEVAQGVLARNPGDPFNLDPSGDGVACSSLPPLQGRGIDGIGQINQINVFVTAPDGDADPTAERTPVPSADREAVEPADAPRRGRGRAPEAAAETVAEPAPEPRPQTRQGRNGRQGGTPQDCHPDYADCLPVVDDLDCGDPRIPGDGTVRLKDPENDAYGLAVSRGVGNGVACDDES